LLEEGIYENKNLRTAVEGVIYRMRTGVPWRDVPKEFGRWNSMAMI
jgi:transposase